MRSRFLSLLKKIPQSLQAARAQYLIESSGLFDPDWYLAHYPDVRQAGIDPLMHYLKHGGFEGRDPGPGFDSRGYREAYPDVKNAGINPLVHYLTFGQAEGRLARPHTKVEAPAHPLYSCPVCRNRVEAFIPLSSFYLENFKRYGYPYTAEDVETINMEQYSCPHCGASDRDRLYACYLEKKLSQLPAENPLLLLDIAPSVPLSRLFGRFKNIIRHTADLLARDVDFTVDVTNMPEIASDSYDALICSHVLEHVRDDGKALAELYRVLKPGGWAILMVPIITSIDEIDEDPDLTDEAERWRRFGQGDHVRLYSKRGFIERVEKTGFRLHQLGVDDFGESIFREYGVTNKSVLYIGEKREESNFQARLSLLIEENSHYEYPKSDFAVEPTFDQPVRIVESPAQRHSIQEQALERLKREYDVKGLESTYSLLNDQYSKDILVRVIAARLMGMSRSRFPLYYSHIWKFFDALDELRMDGSTFKVGTWDFFTYDLGKLGFDLTIHVNKMGAFICYVMEQYKYKDLIYAREGDYVIDGGACYGDTALYFADRVKKNGKVFSFEFISNNLELLRKNVALNPGIQDRLHVVERPLWSNSNTELSAVERGSASYLSEMKAGEGTQVYRTISIDDFVKQHHIEKIDFIKLDIEGAELETLKGAVSTLQQHKPQLAICLYHKHSDFSEIPRFLHELVPEYKFYLDHFALNLYETVLFGTVNPQDTRSA